MFLHKLCSETCGLLRTALKYKEFITTRLECPPQNVILIMISLYWGTFAVKDKRKSCIHCGCRTF